MRAPTYACHLPLLRLLTLGSISAASLAPSAASACATAPSSGVLITTHSLPSAGVLTGYIYGCPNCTVAGLQVLDPFGAEVVGTFIELPESLRRQGWFGFRPAEPWVEGARYEAYFLQGGQPRAHLGSIVVEPVSSAEPRVSARLGHVEWGIDPVPCLELAPPARGPQTCGLPVLMARSLVAAELVVQVEESTGSPQAYRVTWTRDGQPVEPDSTSRDPWRFSQRFVGVPSEVCFELFGTPLTENGVERSIARECKHVDAEGLGTKEGPFEPWDGYIASALSACSVPPRAYRALWCQTLWACKPNPNASGAPGESCAQGLAKCMEGDDSPKPSGDDDADMTPSTASGAHPALENDDIDGGCSASRSGGRSSVPLALLALLGVLGRRRRGRR